MKKEEEKKKKKKQTERDKTKEKEMLPYALLPLVSSASRVKLVPVNMVSNLSS